MPKGHSPARIAEIAAMLEHMSEPEREKLLGNLAAQDPALAEELKRGLFPFHDLARLMDTHLRELISAVPRPTLVLALRAVDDADLHARILACLPARAREALLEEVRSAGPRKLSEVKEAQRKIGELARELERQGKIWREA